MQPEINVILSFYFIFKGVLLARFNPNVKFWLGNPN